MSSAMDTAIPDRRATEGSVYDRAASPNRVFWATWFGWMLDGFDYSMYGYILVTALTELLPASGLAASPANVSLYGGLLFTVFMLGWACSMVWGWAADRLGRVRVMCWTVLVYSLFTGLCGLSTGLVMFAMFRFVAGFGIGGEWATGTPLLHESVPESVRVRMAGWLHTAAPTGLFLAALTTLICINTLGWRGMFFLGVTPALLTLYLRRRIPEPRRRGDTAARPKFAALFAGTQARTTWSGALMTACIIFGLWSSNYWAPTFVISRLMGAGTTPQYAQTIGAVCGLITSAGTFLGCFAMPWITRRMGGRRPTALLFFLGSAAAILASYAFAILHRDDLMLFMLLLPVLGFFTNGVFALFSIWLPEMFPAALRGAGSGFCFSFGRLLGAAGPALVGGITALTGSYPMTISALSAIYVIGLPFILLAKETANEPLPA